MKKVLFLFTVFALTLALTACAEPETVTVEVEVPAELAEIPTDLTLDADNFDEFLGRPDVQYVDLRNWDDKLKSGYVGGFEFIPFFDYLEGENVLVRTDGNWEFAAEDIVNQAQLENLFDADKTIFLMCGSGTRAGFVKDALVSLGYDVVNVGGFTSYAGGAKVLGDNTYTINRPAKGDYTPGTYFAVDPTTQYTATIVVGVNGAIEDVVFDAMYNGTTKNTLDAAYTLGSGTTWKAEAEMLADYIVANQGWGDIVLDVTDLTGLNYLTVPHHAIYLDTDASPDDVAGVSIGAEGFVLAWNLAIAQASSNGTGLVENVPTAQEWADAHAPAFDYVDGTYFGMDEDSGYNVKVVVEDGLIVDVYFDALRATVEIQTNDNGTPADPSDDYDEAVVVSWTTKQVLQEGYTLGSGVTWAAEADELAAAIIDAQQWDPSWVVVAGVDGGHDTFDMTDTDTADAVGGVTIGIEGFIEAFEEAIAQATPAE
jgi:rhodanese-related sulfurtransferase